MKKKTSEQVKPKQNWIRRIFDWIWILPLWKRTLATSAIGGLIGSPFVYLINKLAIHIYSSYSGIRQPIEGIDFLGLLVTIFSSVFAVLATVISISIFTFFKISKKYNDLKLDKADEANDSSLKLNLLIRIWLILILLLYVLMNNDYLITHIKKYGLFLIMGVAIFLSLFTLWIAKKKAMFQSLISLIITILIIVTLSITLLFPKVYSKVLVLTGYGGGIPKIIQYENTEGITENVEGKLILRTNTHTFIRTQENKNVEISNKRISKRTDK